MIGAVECVKRCFERCLDMLDKAAKDFKGIHATMSVFHDLLSGYYHAHFNIRGRQREEVSFNLSRNSLVKISR